MAEQSFKPARVSGPGDEEWGVEGKRTGFALKLKSSAYPFSLVLLPLFLLFTFVLTLIMGCTRFPIDPTPLL